MSKARAKVREELAKRLMDALIARLDAPLSLVIPAEMLEPMHIDEDWLLFKETHPDVFEPKPAPSTIKRLKEAVSGTKPITIRVPVRVLAAYRHKAEEKGVPYQKLMNRALAEVAGAIE